MAVLFRWLTCLFALALLAPLPAGAETVYGGVISGKVLGPDGKPVAGAAVCLEVNAFQPKQFPDFQVKTRADGSFAFRPLKENQYAALVFAVKPGLGVAALQIEERKDRTGLTLRLRRGAPVELRLTDAAGSPVRGATLHMLHGSWSKAEYIAYFDCLAARSDAAGKIRIPWLSAGDTALVSIQVPGFGLHEQEITAGAGPVAVRLTRAARIVGRVVHAGTGKPEPFVEVGCQRLEEWEQGADTGKSQARPDADGNYVLSNLQPGDYVIWARDYETPPKWVALRHRVTGVTAGGLVKCPDLVLQTGAVITGKVVDAATGKAIPFPTAGASTPGKEKWNTYFEAWAYGDGTFSLRVPAGTWTLIPGLKEGYLPIADQARTLKEGEQVKDVVLKLAPR